MVKKNLMIILLSIILLTGCEFQKNSQETYVNDYTNVSYVEGKTKNDITTTTTTTTTTPIVNTTTSTTTTSKTTVKTTKKTTTTTTQVVKEESEVAAVVEETVKDEYTGPKTNELIDEAKAYIVKYSDKINEMIELINIERAKEGLNPLKYDYDMTLAATVRSLEMHYTGVFEHARYCRPSAFKTNENGKLILSDGDKCRKWSSVFADLRITYNRAGENIAKGFGTVAGAMGYYDKELNKGSGFMGSKDHRANILKPEYTYVGIGVAETKSGTSYYFAQEFKA